LIERKEEKLKSVKKKEKLNPSVKEFIDSIKKGEDKYKDIEGFFEIIKKDEFREIGLTQELIEAGLIDEDIGESILSSQQQICSQEVNWRLILESRWEIRGRFFMKRRPSRCSWLRWFVRSGKFNREQSNKVSVSTIVIEKHQRRKEWNLKVLEMIYLILIFTALLKVISSWSLIKNMMHQSSNLLFEFNSESIRSSMFQSDDLMLEDILSITDQSSQKRKRKYEESDIQQEMTRRGKVY
jgi:hypothetical protein